MKLSNFDYNLPKKLIANSHIEPRDHSRLLVVDRKSGKVEHKRFYNILDYLRPDDLLVFNNSKVFKAKIFGTKDTGGKREFLITRPVGGCLWEVMIKRKAKVGDKFSFGKELNCKIVKRLDERLWRVKLNKNQKEVFKFLEKNGETPLPPYIKCRGAINCAQKKGVINHAPTKDRENNFYQTVYAKNTGSVAAPTAGFHFTKDLLKKIKAKGIECSEVTLHVGLGTFVPVEVENIKNHKMHTEYYKIKKDVWDKILKAKKEKRRVIAVGTTTTRVLESFCRKKGSKTDIFIYPPFDFKIVDCLITNFHLPKSTLLILISAFLDPKGKKGIGLIKKIYAEAIKKNIGSIRLETAC